DTEAIRTFADKKKAWANIPPGKNRKSKLVFNKWLHKQRNLVERFFNKLENYRGIATRYGRNPENLLAAIKIIDLRIIIKINESAA
ncbi:MAG: IS5/IS1182 family transposase, partial [Geminicoccaceae bacterium]